ncbi:MAG: GatB/YqeY domain-containing protein [Gammaproteobacteria bacterium]|nr:GatB/YqeY domain-containing protein [Gammaproteobacteria bacterium]
MEASLKHRLQEDMKAAMRAKESRRLGIIRLINAAIKQREVDERISLDDEQVIIVLSKMIKQRNDSIDQYGKAGRQDLVDQEAYELKVIEEYLPPALSDEELSDLIERAVAQTGAQSIKDMGKVMGVLKPQIQGRADMGAVGARIRARLA